MAEPFSKTRRAGALGLLAAIFAGAFGGMDALTAPADPEPLGVGASTESSRPGRMFFLLVDSLRYQTATDPSIMPELCARSARKGLSARVRSSFDKVTVPALRAAFTGRDRTSVFGFLRNFAQGSERVPSLLTEYTARGGTTAVYSDGSFLQFGDDVTARYPNEEGAGDEYTRQDRAVASALEAFQQERYDFVIAHITYSDHVAHESGIEHEEYRRQYGLVDGWVKRLDEALPKDVALIVAGDHGHDALGRHTMGLEVPTYFWARGPSYPDRVLKETRPITSYFGEIRRGLGMTAQETPPAAASVQPSLVWFAMLVLGASLLLALWFRIVTWRAWWIRSIAAFVLLAAWGAILLRLRVHVHWPAYGTIGVFWLAVAAAGAVVARRYGVMAAAWTALAVPGLLAYPTVYRYGAPAVMAPALLCWALFVAARHPRRAALVFLPLLALFLQPFFFVEATNFHFHSFYGFVTVQSPLWWAVLSFVALSVLFLRIGVPRLHQTGAILVACSLVLAQSGVVPVAAGGLVAATAFLVRVPLLRRAAILAFLLLSFQLLVRVPAPAYAWLDLVLAALAVAARYVRTVADRPTTVASYPFLLLIGLLGAGWAALAWNAAWFEWGILYEIFPAAFVETNVAWFLPLILLRYVIPVVLVRLVLRDEFADLVDEPRRTALALAGVKFAALLAITLGLGFAGSESRVYHEGVHHTAIWFVLMLGLTLGPGPTTPSATTASATTASERAGPCP